MAVSRRRLVQSLALSTGFGAAADAAEPAVTLNVLRSVSVANGTNFSDERLRVIRPVLENRLPQLRTIREFDFDDSVEPTQGILDK